MEEIGGDALERRRSGGTGAGAAELIGTLELEVGLAGLGDQNDARTLRLLILYSGASGEPSGSMAVGGSPFP
jgi:hypothetical protein